MGPKRMETIRAYHEAGHAVIGHVLGVEVSFVAAFPTSDKSAAMVLNSSAAFRARNISEKIEGFKVDCKVALAGPHAQLRYVGAQRARDRDYWRGDIEQARSSAAAAIYLREGGTIDTAKECQWIELNEACGVEAVRLFHQLWDETAVLVSNKWPAIERTAQALVKRRILFSDDVAALVAGLNPLTSQERFGASGARTQ
jgi:hypothetical protein